MEQDKIELNETHVKCPICSKELKIIQSRHIKLHGFTLDEFKSKFPEAKLISDVHKKKLLKATEIRSKLSYDNKWSDAAKENNRKAKEKLRTKEPRMYDIKLWNMDPDKCKNCSNDLPFELAGRKFCDKKECLRIAHSQGSKFVTEHGKSMMGVSKKFRNEDGSRKSFDYLCKYCRDTVAENQVMSNNRKVCNTCKSLNLQKRQKNMSEIKKYRSKCSFKFSLNDFPNEFDFSLIEKYGWYSAANRGNNLNGISRDHMISIMYGFKNEIPAEIISHPANCRLMQHKDNVSKYDKCSLTIKELLENIAIWDKKYGGEYGS